MTNFSDLLNAPGEYPDYLIPLNISKITKRGYITINIPELEKFINDRMKYLNFTNTIKVTIKSNKMTIKMYSENDNFKPVELGYILFGIYNYNGTEIQLFFYKPYTRGNNYYLHESIILNECKSTETFPSFCSNILDEISKKIVNIIIHNDELYINRHNKEEV